MYLPRRTPTRTRPTGVPRLNRASPLAKGLVAWFPFSEGQPTLIGDYTTPDFTLQGHDGQFNNDAGALDPGPRVVTEIGFAHNNIFAGATDTNVELENPAVLYSDTGFTVAAWVVRNGAAFGASGSAIWARWGGSGDRSFILWGFGNNLRFGNATSGLLDWVGGGGILNDGRPHLIVGTGINNGFWGLYHNARLVKSSASATLVDGGAPIRIGCYGAAGAPVGPWQGYIAEACLWNRALSREEILYLYAPQTRFDLHTQRRNYYFVAPGAAQEVVGHGRLLSDERNRLVVT